MPRPPRKQEEPEFDPAELLNLASGSSVFLDLRHQNIELLKIAIDLADKVKPDKSNASDPRAALEHIWNIYAELYEWVDPEQTEDEDE